MLFENQHFLQLFEFVLWLYHGPVKSPVHILAGLSQAIHDLYRLMQPCANPSVLVVLLAPLKLQSEVALPIIKILLYAFL